MCCGWGSFGAFAATPTCAANAALGKNCSEGEAYACGGRGAIGVLREERLHAAALQMIHVLWGFFLMRIAQVCNCAGLKVRSMNGTEIRS